MDIGIGKQFVSWFHSIDIALKIALVNNIDIAQGNEILNSTEQLLINNIHFYTICWELDKSLEPHV